VLHLVTFTALSEFPDRLEAHIRAFAPEALRAAPPSWDGCPDEPFTAIERLCACRDTEIDGYEMHISRTVTEDNPTLTDMDALALREDRGYGDADADEVLASFRAARKRTLSILEGLTPDQWRRPACLNGVNTTTLGLVHLLGSHDYQCLASLQWLMARLAVE
jgi:hypothetical protein